VCNGPSNDKPEKYILGNTRNMLKRDAKWGLFRGCQHRPGTTFKKKLSRYNCTSTVHIR
jgi:hypothetical protein